MITIKPKVHDVEDIKEIRRSLQERGYAVIQVMTPKEAAKILTDFRAWISSLDPRVNIDNPKQEYFPDNNKGIFKAYEVGHAPFMWTIRNNSNIRRTFARLLRCKDSDLIHAFDGACYMPREFTKTRNWYGELWPHRDQHPLNNDFMTYQGSLNLIANNHTGDGGFVAWPATHKLTNWCKLMPEECAATSRNFFRIPFGVNGIIPEAARRVIVPVGALTLWDSRLIHCNVSPYHSKRDRAVAYVCMADKRKASQETLQKIRYCEENRLSTSHNPYEFTINENKVMFTNSKIIPKA